MDKIGPYQIAETIHRGPQPLYRARGKDGKDIALKAVAVANLGEEGRILPSTAAKLKDGSAMQAGQRVPRDHLIEITRQVPI